MVDGGRAGTAIAAAARVRGARILASTMHPPAAVGKPHLTLAVPTMLDIRIDDLRGPEVIALLDEHLRAMAAVSPPESCHALNPDGLRRPDVTFWTAWDGPELAGCAALRELDPLHGEIKSMRTRAPYLRRGVASRMLRWIVDEGARRGYRRLSLETGSMPYFDPARRMYARFGFAPCGPFGGYAEDPNSVFMTLKLP
jgi:putative acetyltransferase